MQGQKSDSKKPNMSVKAKINKIDLEEREIAVEGFILTEKRKLTTLTEGLFTEDGNSTSTIEHVRSICELNNISKGKGFK